MFRKAVFLWVYWMVGIGTMVSVENARGPYANQTQEMVATITWPAQWAKLIVDITIKVKDN